MEKDNALEYYVMDLKELVKILNRMQTDLNDMELKWTKKNGFEICILNFGN